MRLIIQKFGGSSVATAAMREKVVEHILAAKKGGFTPVVVVSAMGRKGDPYATDTLLEFFRQIVSAPPPREIDLVLSCGEVLSACVMVAQLSSHGVKAVALTGSQAGIVTDGVYGEAEIVRVKKEKILRLLQDGKLVIVAGFQGISEHGEVNTLGRGGSDTTAVALGAALEAELVEIYSDVDAVMTADPRLVPEAKAIKDIGYQEVLQMAREGAKVIHPRAVDIALQYALPLLLKKTGSTDCGTLVTHKKAVRDKSFIAQEKVVNGITYVGGLAQVRLQNAVSSGLELEEVLQKLGAAGIRIDLINLSPQEKIFTVPAIDCEQVKNLLAELDCQASVIPGFAKVTVVGRGVRENPSAMTRIVRALNSAQTEILQTAYSHLNISCLILEESLTTAVKVLHLEFNLSE